MKQSIGDFAAAEREMCWDRPSSTARERRSHAVGAEEYPGDDDSEECQHERGDVGERRETAAAIFGPKWFQA